MAEKTNFEILLWGVKHIAENHGFNSNTEDWEEDGEVCIWGGCNVPTLCDVQMLCDDLGIPGEYIESSEYGIDIFIPQDWYDLKRDMPFKGMCLWKRNALLTNL